MKISVRETEHERVLTLGNGPINPENKLVGCQKVGEWGMDKMDEVEASRDGMSVIP